MRDTSYTISIIKTCFTAQRESYHMTFAVKTVENLFRWWWWYGRKLSIFSLNQSKLFSVDIKDVVLSILTHFLSNRSQHFMADGCHCKQLVIDMQECCRAVFWAVIVPPQRLNRSFFPSWWISLSVMPMISLWLLLRYPQVLKSHLQTVAEPRHRQGLWVVWPLGDDIEC